MLNIPLKYHLIHQFSFLKNVTKKLHVGQVMDRIACTNTQSTSPPGLSDMTFFACQLLKTIQSPLLKIEDALFPRIWQFFKAFSGLCELYACTCSKVHKETHQQQKRKKLCKAVVRLSYS